MAPSFDNESSLFDFVVRDGNGVKGIVDSGISKVPRAYIQPPSEQIDKKNATKCEIAPIDLSRLDGPHHDEVVNQIVRAAETLGFFQVINHGPTRSRAIPVVPKSAEPVTTCLDSATPTQSLSSSPVSMPVLTPVSQMDRSSASNSQTLVPGQSSSTTEIISNNDVSDAPSVCPSSNADSDQSSDQHMIDQSSEQHISADPAPVIQEKEAAKILEYNQSDSCIKMAAGVPVELLDSLKRTAHDFFALPPERKAVYRKEVSPSPLVKYGTSFVPEKEKALEWKDYISMAYTNDAEALQHWPVECRDDALQYLKTSHDMVRKLLDALMGNLGVELDDSKMDAFIGKKMVNMNFYPTCPNPELTIGVGRHSDMGTLTILLQDGIGGLYVKVSEDVDMEKKGEWVEIPPIPGAIVINIGDIDDALQYLKTSHDMVRKLLDALMGNLGGELDDSKMDAFTGKKMVNMNFYPTCPNPELTVGVGRHSDMGTLTILLQDGIGGLYVKVSEDVDIERKGEWVEIPPIPGAIVINVGDMLQHVYREGNRVADRMAIKGRMQRGLNVTFIEVSTEVRELVAGKRSQSDLDGVDSTEEGAIPYDPGGGTSFC
ncbi:hypothetical protein GQ457_01G003060 [Hibiscus cannabinus]